MAIERGNSTKRALSKLAGLSVPLPNLPEEIITEILLRLPVKTLLRFRCVSKSWLSLISSPQFVETHLQISSKSNIYSHNRLIIGSGPLPMVFSTFSLRPNLDENSSMDNSVFDYPTSGMDDEIRIVGSCNGLICVAVYPHSVVLWNPATRKSKKLPLSDRYLSRLEYGFGYDSCSDDYKVVESGWIFRDDPEVCETQMKVYSCRADTWRTVDWPGGKILHGPGVFVNGAIHWKVYDAGRPRNWAVVAQNVTTVTCSSVELPKRACGSDDGNVMLGVSGGCLCASYDYYSYMDVWVLKESGRSESWTKLVCVPYFFCTRRNDHVRVKLLFVSENGGVLISLGSDLIMYKPSQYHEVHRLSNDVEVEAATYTESLLSPDFDPELVLE